MELQLIELEDAERSMGEERQEFFDKDKLTSSQVRSVETLKRWQARSRELRTQLRQQIAKLMVELHKGRQKG